MRRSAWSVAFGSVNDAVTRPNAGFGLANSASVLPVRGPSSMPVTAAGSYFTYTGPLHAVELSSMRMRR